MIKKYLWRSTNMQESEQGIWVHINDYTALEHRVAMLLSAELDMQKHIMYIQKDKAVLEALAEELQKNKTKWAKCAVEWEALSDDYLEQLVKEIKVSAFNGTAAVVFLVIIILQNLGVIPCLK